MNINELKGRYLVMAAFLVFSVIAIAINILYRFIAGDFDGGIDTAAVLAIGIISGVVLWYFFGFITPYILEISILFNFNKSLRFFFCPKEEVEREGTFISALNASFFPTAIALFIIAYALKISPPIEEEGYVFGGNVLASLLLIFSPAITSFIVPVRIMLGSTLRAYDEMLKEVLLLGRKMRIRLNSIGGFISIVTIILLMYSAYDGKLGRAAQDLIFSTLYAYFIIFFTVYIYYRKWHDKLVMRFEERMKRKGFPTCGITLRIEEIEDNT